MEILGIVAIFIVGSMIFRRLFPSEEARLNRDQYQEAMSNARNLVAALPVAELDRADLNRQLDGIFSWDSNWKDKVLSILIVSRALAEDSLAKAPGGLKSIPSAKKSDLWREGEIEGSIKCEVHYLPKYKTLHIQLYGPSFPEGQPKEILKYALISFLRGGRQKMVEELGVDPSEKSIEQLLVYQDSTTNKVLARESRHGSKMTLGKLLKKDSRQKVISLFDDNLEPPELA